jgi:hypothetical protein
MQTPPPIEQHPELSQCLCSSPEHIHLEYFEAVRFVAAVFASAVGGAWEIADPCFQRLSGTLPPRSGAAHSPPTSFASYENLRQH